MRRNAISLAAVLFFALFMMTGCVISPRRTLGGSATPTPTPTATPTPTPSGTPTPTPVVPTNRLYVSNQNTNSIAVFASGLTATGNVAPSTTIVGGATTLNAPQYMAFDPVHDRLFVANVGTGTILIFDSASKLTGNAPPTRTIGGTASGLVSPSDVAYDATHDALYVLDVTDIAVYNTISNPAVNGDRLPDKDITVAFNLTAFFLDVAGDRLYGADAAGNAIQIWDNVSALPSGVAPVSRTVAGAATKLSQPFGVALDPAKNLVVSNSGGAGSITVYSASSVATGTSPLNVAPIATITGASTTLATPAQIILNTVSTGGEMIVADSAAGAVTTFTNVSASGGNTAPARHIAGSATTLTLTGQPTARGVALDTTAR